MKKVIKLTESDLISIIKNIIRENTELNEIGGISIESRNWSEILVSKIKESGGKNFTLYGKKFPEIYEKFPVDKFDIEFKPIGAYAYDQDNSGYVGNEYVVSLIIDPNLIYKIQITVLNHEMKHAYQDFKRYENKSVGIKDSNFIKNMYTDDFAKIVTDFLRGYKTNDTLIKILYIYYILSDVEQTAYLENIYDEGINQSSLNFESQIIGSIKLLNNLDFTNLDEKTWIELKKLNIPFIKKFKSKEEFARYSERYLKKMSEKFNKKINKMKYLNFPEKFKKEDPKIQSTKNIENYYNKPIEQPKMSKTPNDNFDNSLIAPLEDIKKALLGDKY